MAYSGARHSCRGLTVALSLPGPNGLALRPESQGKIAGGVEDPLELSYRIVQGTLAQAPGLLKNFTRAVAHPSTIGNAERWPVRSPGTTSPTPCAGILGPGTCFPAGSRSARSHPPLTHDATPLRAAVCYTGDA